MMNGDRMVFRDLVEVMNVELPVVLDLGVVEEIALHPIAGRRLARLWRSFSMMLSMVTNSTSKGLPTRTS